MSRIKIPPVLRPGVGGLREIESSGAIAVVVLVASSSHRLLDEAALDAVRQWKFTPTLLNGSPVGVVMTTTVNFTLQ